LRSGRRKCAPVGHEAFELPAGEALVGDHGMACRGDAFEHLGGDLPLRGVGRKQFEGDRAAVGGEEEMEAEAPEPAAVGGAVAVGGDAGELRSA
jgi:hypothetical protein